MCGASPENIFWDGLVVAFPYYAVTIANAFNGKKNIRSRGDKVPFYCPDFKALIVDDLEINLKIIQGLLAPYRMQITTCKNAVHALELIQKHDFDLVLLDQMMPDMDGLETIKVLRSMEGQKYQDIPVVAMTANIFPGIREDFLKKGFNDYLSKPIETYRINEFLERWVGKDCRQPVLLPCKSILSIKGLDEGRGIASCFHSWETYRELLLLYCEDLDYRLKFLWEAINENYKFTDEKNSRLLSDLHIIKSACKIVGALSFAKTVSILEMSAGRGDTKQLSGFAQDLETFRKAILKALQSV